MDFNVAEYAVTIRQSQLLRRREREWGSIRLAVEGKFHDDLIGFDYHYSCTCTYNLYHANSQIGFIHVPHHTIAHILLQIP